MIGGGMGPPSPGTIPWTVVIAWCEHHGFTYAESELLDRCLLSMDADYHEWWARRQRASVKGK